MVDNVFPFKSYIPDYVNGLRIINNATTPLTKIDVLQGSCIDMEGIYQITLSSTVTIDATVNGINGLDKGSFSSLTVYAVYLVADPVELNPTGAIISESFTEPTLPYGYTAFKLIGYAVSDPGAAQFSKGYWTGGKTNQRWFYFDEQQILILSQSGKAIDYDEGLTSLTGRVPAIDNTPVIFAALFEPDAAGNEAHFQGSRAAGDQKVITAQVASVPITQQINLLAQVLFPPILEFSYKVTDTNDTLSLSLVGFGFVV